MPSAGSERAAKDDEADDQDDQADGQRRRRERGGVVDRLALPPPACPTRTPPTTAAVTDPGAVRDAVSVFDHGRMIACRCKGVATHGARRSGCRGAPLRLDGRGRWIAVSR